MSDRFTVHPVPTDPTVCGSYYQSIGGICVDINFYTTFLEIGGIIIVGLTVLTKIILRSFKKSMDIGFNWSIIKIGSIYSGIFLFIFILVLLFLNGTSMYNRYFGF